MCCYYYRIIDHTINLLSKGLWLFNTKQKLINWLFLLFSNESLWINVKHHHPFVELHSFKKYKKWRFFWDFRRDYEVRFEHLTIFYKQKRKNKENLFVLVIRFVLFLWTMNMFYVIALWFCDTHFVPERKNKSKANKDIIW